jgi:protease I
MTQRILLITGDGGESYETLYAIHRFQEAEYEAVVAAPSKRRLHLVTHDFEPGWDTYIERPGYGVEAQVQFEEVLVDDYRAVLMLGGRAPEYLRNMPRVVDIVNEFHQKGKLVCAICHGIQVLVKAGLVEGRCVTCYEHVRFEVESNGGTYSTQEAYRDGRIITAQTWMSHPQFYREIFQALNE